MGTPITRKEISVNQYLKLSKQIFNNKIIGLLVVTMITVFTSIACEGNTKEKITYTNRQDEYPIRKFESVHHKALYNKGIPCVNSGRDPIYLTGKMTIYEDSKVQESILASGSVWSSDTQALRYFDGNNVPINASIIETQIKPICLDDSKFELKFDIGYFKREPYNEYPDSESMFIIIDGEKMSIHSTLYFTNKIPETEVVKASNGEEYHITKQITGYAKTENYTIEPTFVVTEYKHTEPEYVSKSWKIIIKGTSHVGGIKAGYEIATLEIKLDENEINTSKLTIQIFAEKYTLPDIK